MTFAPAGGLRSNLPQRVATRLSAARQAGGESRTLGKKRVAVKVTTDDDIEGTTGRDDEERSHSETPGRAQCSFDSEPVPRIDRGAPIFIAQVIGVRGVASYSVSVPAGAAEPIGGVQKDLLIETTVQRQDQLILIEDSGRFVLKDVAGITKRPDAAVFYSLDESAGQWRVDVAGAQLM